jgi:diguanylate cyclase (GGDEF)-like protein
MRLENNLNEPKKPLVMVVDDDFSARLQVRAALEKYGFAVSEAANGLEALDNFGIRIPDLVLLDVVMPEMDGFETCRRLRTTPGGEHTPVVMVTGLEDIGSIDRAFEVGGTDFITKPINWAILGYRVRYWLRSATTFNDLKVSQQRLSKAQQVARLGHWELNLDTGKFHFSSEVPQLLGVSDRNNFETLFENIISADKNRVTKLIKNACKTEQPFTVNYQIKMENEKTCSIFNQAEIIHDDAQNTRLMVGTIQDITELKEAEDQIRYLAFYDNLTGLANRSLFREHWNKVVAHAQRNKTKIAIMFLDLDHFKRINDTLGHPAGDKVLKTIADRLKSTLRQTDVVARPGLDESSLLISRLGGDEFTILASDITSLNNIARLAERITETLHQSLEIEGQEINITSSMGISVFPEDGDDIDVLLKNADTAMYEAKEKGRNNFQFFQKEMNESARARFEMWNSLNQAIEKDELTLYYQPQFCNRSGKLTGTEALVRWQHPENGLIPPDKFLPFAEESGLIHQINEWVLWKACRQAQEWFEAGLLEGRRMAINISGHNVNLKLIGSLISRIMGKTGLSPQNLEIELTERVMMENTEEAVAALKDLQEMGISIAIDDFGTGYSALSHLQIFPLNSLKIDKSFIQNIMVEEKNLSLIHSIIGIAKSFSLKVIAEGVETKEQLSALAQLKCDDVQGYLLGRPVPSEEVENKLRTGTYHD